MSSILRALKKLEEEGKVNDSRHGWPQGVGPYVRVEGKAGLGRLWFVAAALLVAGFLGGLGLFLKGVFPAANNGSEVAEETAVLPLSEDASVAASVFSQSAALPVEAKTVTSPPPRRETIDIAEESLAAVKIGEVVVARSGDTETAALPGTDRGNEVIVEQRVEAASLYPVLQASELHLQAVAWSEIPAQRVAVIGNRVVKEGDFVVGYLVVRINQDDIVVRKQGVTSRILFSGR